MPPDTSGYYHAAYAVVALAYGLYTVTLLRRRARVRARLAALDRAAAAGR